MEKKGKIYLNMILKDTEPVEMVERAIDSVKEYVDGMYMTITYRDQPQRNSALVEKLNSYGAVISFFKWISDFAAARNFAMQQVPKGEESYIFWIDADDVVANPQNLRMMVREAIHLQHAAVFLDYWYSVDTDKDGNVVEINIEHKRERLIRNDDTFKWIGALHETLIEQRQENVQKVFRDEAHVVHLTTRERSDNNLERNINILEATAKSENHRDPRTLVYLGKGYFDKALDQNNETKQGEWLDKALVLFDEYLQGSGKLATKDYRQGSGWPEERSNTWQFVAEIFKLKGDLSSALDANQEAINEAPAFPIYYIERSLLYCQMGDFKKAKIWLQLATAISQPKTTIITTPRDIKLKALEADMRIALHEQRLAHARDSLEKMMDIIPNNEDLKERLIHIVSAEAANKASQSIVFLGKYLEQMKEADKIVPLLQAVPTDLRNEKFYSEMVHKFIPPHTWGKNEITILCGPGFEQWSPKSVEKGIGGSEEAVIYLSQELVKRGWKVTVYANPMHEAGEYDGVTYKQWYDLNINDKFNALILWRSIGMTDFNLKSNFTMVWMHDVPNNVEFLEKRIQKIDKIAVLSQFHKSLFRMFVNGKLEKIPDDKFFMTGNGIPHIDIDSWKGDPHRMCYVSSPDRGLQYLLVNWDKIRKAVPDATLHVYYGFDLFEAFYRDNPGKMKWMNQMLELMKQPGITYHGRVSHQKLHEEINKCGIWAYPTDFCVTGDTLVDMPRNYLTHPMGVPISELVGRINIPTWTFNEQTGDFELKKIQWVRKTREQAKVIKINWTDGTNLKCTPDHKILTYDRDWIEAKDLQIGESVVALKKHIQVEVSVGKGPWRKEHRLIAKNTLGTIPEGYHVDHVDGNPFNNSPENFQYLSPAEHAKKTFTGNKRTKQARKKQAESYKLYTKTEEGKESLKKRGSERGHKFWDNLSTEERSIFITEREIVRQQKLQQASWNHKVASIEDAGYEDVYDMLVEDNHNFIAGGVVIHNCEISCISAMKAQRLGAVPVVTDYAALKETVRNGIKVNVDIADEDQQQIYIDALITLLKDPKEQKAIRDAMVPFAVANYSWEKVAQEWDALIKVGIQSPASLLEAAMKHSPLSKSTKSIIGGV